MEKLSPQISLNCPLSPSLVRSLSRSLSLILPLLQSLPLALTLAVALSLTPSLSLSLVSLFLVSLSGGQLSISGLASYAGATRSGSASTSFTAFA
jgi:hypothetical protein